MQSNFPVVGLSNAVARYGHSLQATGPPGMSGDGQYSGPPTVPLVLYKSPHLAAPLSSGFGPLSVREVTQLRRFGGLLRSYQFNLALWQSQAPTDGCCSVFMKFKRLCSDQPF